MVKKKKRKRDFLRSTSRTRRKNKRKRIKLIAADVHLLESMGFTEEMAKDALLRYNNNVEDAINSILNKKREEADLHVALQFNRGKSENVINLWSEDESDLSDSKLSEDIENVKSGYEKLNPKTRVDNLVQNYDIEKKRYEVEREQLLEKRNQLKEKAKWLQSQSERFKLVRCSEKWPTGGDEGVLWLTQEWVKEEQLINNELKQYTDKLAIFDTQLINTDQNFWERTMQFENEKTVTELLSKDMQSGLRMSVADRNVHLLSSAGKKIEEKYSCSICYCDYVVKEFAILDCLHGFCQSCLKQLIQTKVKDGQLHNLYCPHVDEKGTNCKHQLALEEVRLLIGEDELFEKYERLQLFQTLNQTKDCRWCPKPGCEMAMFGDKSTPMMTCPKCGMKFCFNCKTSEWHKGVSCIQFKKWKKENSGSDAKFESWKKQNAKACPKCKSSIEKNGGCVHMTCTNCKYEFDWKTLEKWEPKKNRRRAENRRRRQRNRQREIDY